MKDPIVIIGIGEMAGVFARGFLKLGHPVYPVTRQMDMSAFAGRMPDPLFVLVAVGEKDLDPVLAHLPAVWRNRLVLLQNELLPRDWEAHGIERPTVIAVWFEKKKGQEYKVIVSSPIHGANAKVIVDALAALDIPAHKIATEQELLFELVRKNLYILTTNITGIAVDGTVQRLWSDNQPLAQQVAEEVMAIQFALIGKTLDRNALLDGMLDAFHGDPAHKCLGRSAPARLARALAHADALAIEVPKLRELAALHGTK